MDAQGVARPEPEEITVSPPVPTPNDIRDRLGAFPRLGRGYDPQPVDLYLRTLADSLEKVAEQNQSLAGQVNELAKKVAFHEGRAWAVQEALVTAQTLQAEARAAAEDEVERLRAEATREADDLLAAAREERHKVLEEVEEASAQVTRVRDHAKAEVEVLREEAVKELAALREVAAAEAEELRKKASHDAREIRDEAEREAKRVEDEALGALERRSAMLMERIEERHQALERLEEKRLEILARLQRILARELEAVESEQAQPPVGQVGETQDGRASMLLAGAPGANARGPLLSTAKPGASAEELVPQGIIMPDNTVVIVPGKAKGPPGPRPLTDAPGPLDPGARDPAGDDDVPIAATDAGSVLPLDEVELREDPSGEELAQQ